MSARSGDRAERVGCESNGSGRDWNSGADVDRQGVLFFDHVLMGDAANDEGDAVGFVVHG